MEMCHHWASGLNLCDLNLFVSKEDNNSPFLLWLLGELNEDLYRECLVQKSCSINGSYPCNPTKGRKCY